MKTYIWKRMVLGALGCMNNADFEIKEKVNDNVVLEVFIPIKSNLWLTAPKGATPVN